MNRFWFKPKAYGYGVTPSTWEGWATVAGYVLAVVASTSLLLDPNRHAGTWTAWGVLVASLTGAMILISRYKTDGSWRWRWPSGNSRNVS
jgi:hypothetical protein